MRDPSKRRPKSKRPAMPRSPQRSAAKDAARDEANNAAAWQAGLSALGLLGGSGGTPLPEGAVERCDAYLRAMLEENESVNLTAIRDPDKARILHALDSLVIWHVVAEAPKIIVDLGSGNGFPGAAAAAIWPEARVICVDRTQKKARAIQTCAARAGLSNIDALAIDAVLIPKNAPALAGSADLVLSRAMADLATTTKLAAPLLARRRSLVLHWKARELESQERADGSKAARSARLSIREDFVYTLPDDEERVRRIVAYVRA